MRVQNLTASVSRPVKAALGHAAERWINRGRISILSVEARGL